METNSQINIVVIFIIAFLIIAMVVAFTIIFFVLSKRKIDKQQLRIKNMEIKHNKEIFSSSIETQEKERKRIAESLHDDIGASISTMGLIIDKIADLSEDEAKKLSLKSREIANRIGKDIKLIIRDLSPTSLTRFGLEPELKNICNLINDSDSIKAIFSNNIKDLRFSEKIEINVFRIIKEFINNSIKYSQADSIKLEVHKIDDQLIGSIQDDGIGFDFDSKKLNGHGLKNIESRIYILDGHFNFSSEPNKGTNLYFEIPLES